MSKFAQPEKGIVSVTFKTMNGIKFTDRRGRKVELSKPHGTAGNVYYLTVNRYHYGQIVKVLGGKWIAYPNNNDLPPAYWDALIKWIIEAESQQDKPDGRPGG